MNRMTVAALVLAAVLTWTSTAGAESGATTIFLVRHTEKADAGEDPGLTDIGLQRARALARTLEDADIKRIYSTDYARTRDTAGPVAAQLGLAVEFYDPRELEAFAASLRRSGQNTLVVGHSNTTPQMVELLGADPGKAIDEKTEFDRLYVVTLDDNGANSIILRYGSD